MTVVAANDTVTYKSPRGDTVRPADMVVAVNADGTAIDGALTTSNLTAVTKAITTAATTEVVAAVALQTIRVHRMTLNVSSACILIFKSATTQLREPMNFTAAGVLILDYDRHPWLTTVVAEALNLTTNNTATVNITVDYVQSA